jgi:acetyltransferase-like isoleucine patch superfamily enzyme
MINFNPVISYISEMSNPWNAEINVGKYTSIANRCMVIVASHPSYTHNSVTNYPFRERHKMRDYPKSTKGGVVNIGNDVWIGDGVTIVGELTIGDGTIIGACSVVAKDVPPYAIVAGNPIKIIRYRFTEEQIKKLLDIKWWEWEHPLIRERIKDFLDINIFITKYGKP